MPPLPEAGRRVSGRQRPRRPATKWASAGSTPALPPWSGGASGGPAEAHRRRQQQEAECLGLSQAAPLAGPRKVGWRQHLDCVGLQAVLGQERGELRRQGAAALGRCAQQQLQLGGVLGVLAHALGVGHLGQGGHRAQQPHERPAPPRLGACREHGHQLQDRWRVGDDENRLSHHGGHAQYAPSLTELAELQQWAALWDSRLCQGCSICPTLLRNHTAASNIYMYTATV